MSGSRPACTIFIVYFSERGEAKDEGYDQLEPGASQRLGE